MLKNKTNSGIILYDGFCNLCLLSVNFILKRDSRKFFRFIALQSETGKELLIKHNFDISFDKSLILIENTKIFTKSDAVLRIFKKLDKLWPLLYMFIFIPRFIRNPVYKIIARKRYKWFGKRDSCYLP